MSMNYLIASSLAAVFICLSPLHAYWALGGRFGLDFAVPELDGSPAFQPSTLATLVVAIGLALCAAAWPYFTGFQ